MNHRLKPSSIKPSTIATDFSIQFVNKTLIELTIDSLFSIPSKLSTIDFKSLKSKSTQSLEWIVRNPRYRCSVKDFQNEAYDHWLKSTSTTKIFGLRTPVNQNRHHNFKRVDHRLTTNNHNQIRFQKLLPISKDLAINSSFLVINWHKKQQ